MNENYFINELYNVLYTIVAYMFILFHQILLDQHGCVVKFERSFAIIIDIFVAWYFAIFNPKPMNFIEIGFFFFHHNEFSQIGGHSLEKAISCSLDFEWWLS